MRIRFLFVLTALTFLSCNIADNKKAESSSAEKLVGEWNNLSMKIDVSSKNNTDENEIFDVPRTKWEEILKIKPIRTFFRADSTWNSDYYNLKDSLVRKSSGRWWVDGEKMAWIQQVPDIDTTFFSVKLVNDTVSFEGLLDWDGDGKKDDKYFGQQVKVSSLKN